MPAYASAASSCSASVAWPSFGLVAGSAAPACLPSAAAASVGMKPNSVAIRATGAASADSTTSTPAYAAWRSQEGVYGLSCCWSNSSFGSAASAEGV